jgi:hypothetical protein
MGQFAKKKHFFLFCISYHFPIDKEVKKRFLHILIIQGKSMDEKETISLLYKKYGKMKLNLKEVCQEIGISYSKASKYFGGDSSYSDEFIKKHKLLPIWERFKGEQRRWKITEIAKWLCNTEAKDD